MPNSVVTGESPNRQDGTPTEAPKPTVLRWEWRAFAPRLPLPPEWQDAPSSNGAAPSDETYFVSSRSTHNVKLRQGRLEMKRLRRIDAHGLELWDPVLTVALPASVDALAALWRAWKVTPPRRAEPALISADVVEQLVAATPWLRAVRVSKRRVPLALGSCRGERVTLLVNGEHWEGVAVESEEPANVLAALRRLGLEGTPNVNYPTMLKRIAGLQDEASSSIRGPND